MKQKTLSRLEATKSPKEVDLQLEISGWLNKYPWSHFWTPTFGNKEQEGIPQYTRAKGVVQSGSGKWSRTGGGLFKPSYADRERTQMHVAGMSERSAIGATKKFLKKFMTEYSYFFISEQNPGREGHHVHCLLIPPAGTRVNVPYLGKLWWEKYGWNKFEIIRCKDDVTGYCTKHITSYCTKGTGWYEIEINDTEVFHKATQTNS